MVATTRRGFLTQVSITAGAGIAGGLGVHKLLANQSPTTTPAPLPERKQPQLQMPDLSGVSLAGPMLIHVRDLASGEVSMMVGTRELVYRDPELVSRLVATERSARTEG